MDNLFSSFKKLMYEYTHIEELTPRRQKVVLSTYSKFLNTYEFVDDLVPTGKKKSSEKKSEKE